MIAQPQEPYSKVVKEGDFYYLITYNVYGDVLYKKRIA